MRNVQELVVLPYWKFKSEDDSNKKVLQLAREATFFGTVEGSLHIKIDH